MDMTKIIADFGSLHFWVSVVFVGIFASILGNFLTKFLDSRVQKFKSWRDQRAKNNDENYQRDLQNLFRSPALVNSLRDREARGRLQGIVSLIIAVALMLIGLDSAYFLIAEGSGAVRLPALIWFTIIFFILSNVMVISHFHYSRLTSRAERLLEDYYSLLAQEEKKGLLPKGK